jgi:hypothetical protein
MEFFHFLFEIHLLMFEEKEKDLKIFVTIMINNYFLEILH